MQYSTDTEKQKLEKYIKKVESAYAYFEDNYKRYNDFRTFTYETTLTESQKEALRNLNRPSLEFNILYSHVATYLGQFAVHEPTAYISPANIPGLENPDPIQLKVIEGHLRHIMEEAQHHNVLYNAAASQISGGFSAFKVFPRYKSDYSISPDSISVDYVEDPTMVGFDPMATKPDKSDGQFVFELFALTKEDFEAQYPGKIQDERFRGNLQSIGPFSWYVDTAGHEKIILCCEMYQKVKRRIEIVKLADGRVMPLKKYNEMVMDWENSGRIDVAPGIVARRKTIISDINRCVFTRSQILLEEKTDYSFLPMVFVDGDSAILRKQHSPGAGGESYQFTRPLCFHGLGMQKLKNVAGQTIAQSMELQVQHKFIVKEEAIPEEQAWRDALTNVQQASTVVVKAFKDNNPQAPIPEPIRQIMHVPLPPEIMTTFVHADEGLQSMIGGFSSNLGKNDRDLSGKAAQEISLISNSSSRPFIVAYLSALTQVAHIIVDLIPKYLKNNDTIACKDKNGETVDMPVKNIMIPHDYDMSPNAPPSALQTSAQEQQPMPGGPQMESAPQMTGIGGDNQMAQESPDGMSEGLPGSQGAYGPQIGGMPSQGTMIENLLDYDPKCLNVRIEAGVSFEVQKSQALQQITALSNANPKFAEFLASDEGMPILVDNLTIYGAERLQDAVKSFLAKSAQQQAQAQQMALQNNPQLIAAKAQVMRAQTDQMKAQSEGMVKQADLMIKKQSADTEAALATAKIQAQDQEMKLREDELETERSVHAADNMIKAATLNKDLAQMHHSHMMDRRSIENDYNRNDKN